jgi:hypothetical protein
MTQIFTTKINRGQFFYATKAPLRLRSGQARHEDFLDADCAGLTLFLATPERDGKPIAAGG